MLDLALELVIGLGVAVIGTVAGVGSRAIWERWGWVTGLLTLVPIVAMLAAGGYQYGYDETVLSLLLLPYVVGTIAGGLLWDAGRVRRMSRPRSLEGAADL